jgi:hypothetical protein
MYIESEAVIGSMLTLMRDHQVPSLPVHDSLIVPASKFNVAKGASRVAWVPRQTHYSSGTGPPCFYGILDSCGNCMMALAGEEISSRTNFYRQQGVALMRPPVFFVKPTAGRCYSKLLAPLVP